MGVSMTDKKLEMLTEIEQIKKQERREELHDLHINQGNSTEQLKLKSHIQNELRPIPESRESYYLEISTKLLHGEITIGEGIQQLRKKFLGLNQEQFAKLVGVSRKTISDIENNRGNLSVETLNAITKPFKFRLALVPISFDILKRLSENR